MHISLLDGALGGIGLFLLGMRFMSEGIRKLADDRIRRLFSRCTSNRFTSLMFGLFMSFSLQSGSAAVILTIALANGGVLSLFQSFGVLSGIMLGASLTLHLHFVNYAFIGAPLVFLGVAFRFFARRRRLSYAGDLLLGIGLLFLGLKLLEATFTPLDGHPFYALFSGKTQENGLIAIGFGMLISCLVQSALSLANTISGLTLAYRMADTALYLMVTGGFLGVAVMGLFASIGGTRLARRVALWHFLLNLLLVILLAAFSSTLLPLLFRLAHTGSPELFSHVFLLSLIAWIHTLAACLLALIESGLSGPLSRMLTGNVSASTGAGGSQPCATYLDPRILTTPTIAVEQARKEIVRMASVVSYMHADVREQLFDFDARRVETIRQHEQVLDALNHEITSFLAELSGRATTPELNFEIPILLQRVTDLEHIGDRCDDILDRLLSKKESNVTFSNGAMDDLKLASGRTSHIVNLVEEAIREGHHPQTRHIETARHEFLDTITLLKNRHFERISTGVCPPRAAMIFNDMISCFERIADLCHNILASSQKIVSWKQQ